MPEIVTEVDPSLSYICDLNPSSVLVYKVARGGSNYVLKVAEYNHEWGLNHIKREGEILALAKDVPGITHMIKEYGVISICGLAILKEYFEGQTLYESELKFISDIKIQNALERSVRDLHSLGIARFDLDDADIILSPNLDEARIIDLGCGLFSKSLSSSEFEKFKSNDLYSLENNLFK